MNRKSSAGFTLIELSIVLIIFGFVAGTFLVALQSYYQQTDRNETAQATTNSRDAVLSFHALYGRYPCPADPRLEPTHANYGREVCAGTAPIIVAGERDADNDGAADNVMIGAVPFKTILDPNNDGDYADGINEDSFTESVTIDGWGRKLLYAVTENLTVEALYKETNGAIDVVDEFNASVLGRPRSGHFVIISAGENGAGWYDREANIIGECLNNAGTSVNEGENCDLNDAVFLQGLRNDQTALKNDDILLTGRAQIDSHWIRISDDPVTGAARMINTNSGNVGVGVFDPTEKFHVDGNVKSGTMHAIEFCDPNDLTNDVICMPSLIISGNEPQMQCATSGTGATAIEQNSLDSHCEPIFPLPGTYDSDFQLTCPAGQGVVGISNINGVICAPL